MDKAYHQKRYHVVHSCIGMALGVLPCLLSGLLVMLHLQNKQEEKYQVVAFGEEYQKYQKQIRRYLGRY